jgi:hypothetical protein
VGIGQLVLFVVLLVELVVVLVGETVLALDSKVVLADVGGVREVKDKSCKHV